MVSVGNLPLVGKLVPLGWRLGTLVSSVRTTGWREGRLPVVVVVRSPGADERPMAEEDVGWVAFGNGVNPLVNSADGSCPLPKAKPPFLKGFD